MTTDTSRIDTSLAAIDALVGVRPLEDDENWQPKYVESLRSTLRALAAKMRAAEAGITDAVRGAAFNAACEQLEGWRLMTPTIRKAVNAALDSAALALQSKDAQRYRFLRDTTLDEWEVVLRGEPYDEIFGGEDLDKAVDAAMEAAHEQQ